MVEGLWGEGPDGAGGDEAQAEGTEEHAGGVPAVQAPQEAGSTEEGTTATQSDEEDGRGVASIDGTPRHLDLMVHSCVSCPFMHHVQVTFKVDATGEEFVAGWYCAHPRRRTATDDSLITSYELVKKSPPHVTSLGSWLEYHERSKFPHTCPLKKPDLAQEPTGFRALDLG